MSNNLYVVSGDWHIGLTSDSIEIDGHPSKVVDTVARARELVDVASKHHNTVIVAGDVFDTSKPHPDDIAALFGVFRYAEIKGVEIILLPGNHDCGTNWMNLVIAEGAAFDNVIVVTDAAVFEPDGISFLPHIPKAHRSFDTVVAALKELDPKTTLISHGQVLGAASSSEMILEAGNAYEFDLRTLPKFKLVVLGHVHKHQSLVSKKGVECVYTGGIVMNDFSEVNDEKVYLLVDPKKGEWKAVPFEVQVQQYRHIKLNLTEKYEVSFSDAKLKKLQGTLLKLSVYVRENSPVSLNEVIAQFSKYSVVVRAEKIVKRMKGEEAYEDATLLDVSYSRLIVEYVASQEELDPLVAKRARVIGREVVEECSVL